MYVDYHEVGHRIAAKRKELGLKQWEVNERAGLSDKYLSNIERGQSIMSIDVLMKICNVLGVTPNYLLVGSQEKVTKEDYEKSILKKIKPLSEKKTILALSLIEWLTEQDI